MLITSSMAKAVAFEPRLWPTAFRAYRSFVPTRWWTRRPFLPIPDRDWMHFRLVTAYGGDGSPPASSEEELITWLRWLKKN